MLRNVWAFLSYTFILSLLCCIPTGSTINKYSSKDNSLVIDIVMLGSPYSGIDLVLKNLLEWTFPSICLISMDERTISSNNMHNDFISEDINNKKYLCPNEDKKSDNKMLLITDMNNFFQNTDIWSEYITETTKFIIILREPIDQLIAIHSNNQEKCNQMMNTRINECANIQHASFREYFVEHHHYLNEGLYVNYITQLSIAFPQTIKSAFIMNIHAVSAEPDLYFNLLANFLYIEIKSSFSYYFPLLDITTDTNLNISCSDYKYFKNRYDYYNIGLDHLIEQHKIKSDYVFSSFQLKQQVFENICGPIKISDFNASFFGPPHIFLIGVNKAGTTSLFLLFTQYLEMRSSQGKKEPCLYGDHFWDERFQEYVAGYYSRLKFTTMRGVDATPSYFTSHSALHDMINLYDRKHFIEKKFIIVLREPIARLLSFYKQRYDICSTRFHENRSDSTGTCNYEQKNHLEYRDTFAKYMLRATREYGVEGGFYQESLLKWLEIIPRKQIFIVNMESLYGDASTDVVRRIFDFVGYIHPIDSISAIPHRNNAEVHCVGCPAEDLAMTCADKEYLIGLYREHNKNLEELINLGEKHPSEPEFLPFAEDTTCS